MFFTKTGNPRVIGINWQLVTRNLSYLTLLYLMCITQTAFSQTLKFNGDLFIRGYKHNISILPPNAIYDSISLNVNAGRLVPTPFDTLYHYRLCDENIDSVRFQLVFYQGDNILMSRTFSYRIMNVPLVSVMGNQRQSGQISKTYLQANFGIYAALSGGDWSGTCPIINYNVNYVRDGELYRSTSGLPIK